MTSLSSSDSWSVEQLLEAVAHLSPADQREFQRRFAARQTDNGHSEANETLLKQAAQTRLPAASERRLRRFIVRSERGQLTPRELADYQSLAQEAQRIDSLRADALAKLARLQGRSVQAVKAALEREGHTHGA